MDFLFFFHLTININCNLYFSFRTPKRELVCSDEKAIFAPIDGRVTKIENIHHKDLGECVEITIKNALYDAGNFNTPFAMSIIDIRLRHGLFCAVN